MPPKPIDYSKTVIYKICCKDLTVKDVYVGSTTNMVKRRCEHKTRCSNEKGQRFNLYVYEFIRGHGGFENWEMVAIEQFPCENDEQKRTRERHWMEALGATLNSCRPIMTTEEYMHRAADYYAANVERIKEKHTAYRATHIEQIKDYHAAYHAAHVEQIKEKGAAYRATHVEHIKERDTAYYAANVEKLKKQRSERITCECGSECRRGDISTHKRTAKHIKAMAAL